MLMKISKRSIAIFALVLLALYSITGIPLGRLQSSVLADSGAPPRGSKLSEDLKQLVTNGSNQAVKGPIPVIIQTLGHPSNGLLSAVGESKGVVHRVCKNVEARDVHIPSAA